MNTKGQFAIIGYFMILLVFIVIWISGLSNIIQFWGSANVVNNNLTGFEAFFYNNLNFLIGGVMMLSLLAVASFGGGQ
jgi:hypothetical protein